MPSRRQLGVDAAICVSVMRSSRERCSPSVESLETRARLQIRKAVDWIYGLTILRIYIVYITLIRIRQLPI